MPSSMSWASSALIGALERYAQRLDFLKLAHAESMLMFGSGYPFWDSWLPNDAAALLPADVREAVLAKNARELYRIS